MSEEALERLAATISASGGVDGELLSAVATAVGPILESPADWAASDAPDDHTEAALHLVDACLPGWTISLKGKASEPDGHWRCTLRESTTRDNDEVLGVGAGQTVALALMAALVRVAQMRLRR